MAERNDNLLRHPWQVSPSEAIAIQRDLAQRVRILPLRKPPRTVAGVDVSFDRGADRLFAGIVLLAFPSLRFLKACAMPFKVPFPYVPGLLTFREGPAILEVFDRLGTKPDVLLFDGQGIAHPRGLGIAAHMGVLLDRPAIGCAKSRLVGEFESPAESKGAWTPLHYRGRQIGLVLRTRTKVKPMYISPGHLVDFDDCRTIVLRCCTKYRLPEPTRLAHVLVNRVKSQGIEKETIIEGGEFEI